MPRVTRSSSPAAKKAAGIGDEEVERKKVKVKSQESTAIKRLSTTSDLGSKNGKNSIMIFSWLQPEKKSDKELDMIKFSGFIREQPDWVNEIKDKKQLAKLIEKFGAFKDDSSSKEIVKSVVKKLNDYLAMKEEEEGSIIDLGACDGTWQSDGLINSALRDQFLINIQILEASIPENQMDWNDKNGQMWNLLSPSMYPLVRERSKVLRSTLPYIHVEGSRKGLIQYHSSERFLSAEEQYNLAFIYTERRYDYSRHFQWLSSEFEIGEDNSVRIASYINNLHPEVHSGLYSMVEEIFGRFIPLFENVLNDLRNEIIKGKRSKGGLVFKKEMQEFQMAGKTLQVITKFTNILLTPEKPNYPGGNFHTEGMANEKIIATGIYYYSCENIIEPRLEFQESVSGWELIEEKTRRSIPYDQKLGSILTKEGRCIAFPNNLEHRVTPFELKDPTKSGHRKILAFFLVDPTKRVISTRHVPPQQKSWFVQEIMKEPICFPQEIVEMILKKLDWPMDFKEAKEHWDEIQKERKPEADERLEDGNYYARQIQRRQVTRD